VTQLLYFARAAADLIAGPDVQLFPPGNQVGHVSTGEGKAQTLTLTIDAETAAVLEDYRAQYQAAADAGSGDAPYLDFNHEDREAAAWVKKVFWAGDHPLEGGVRAEVEWSAAGAAAIEGKSFRRFSPCFHADAKKGRVTGAPVNFGGLVNRAGFSRIQPLFAKSPNENPNETKPAPSMTDQEITALQDELTALRNENAALKKELDARTKAEAETLVAAAAKDGRIPPAPEFQAKWVAQICANPAAKELLASMPANAPGQAPAYKATPDGKTESPEALLAKFNDLPREEKPAFFRAHREALVSLR